MVGVATLGLSVSTIYAMFNLLQEVFGVGADFTAARAELQDDDVKEAMACAILFASTPASAESFLDAVLEAEAPNAAPLVRILPLRWLMNHLFNLEADGSGYGGACRDCDAPDYIANFGQDGCGFCGWSNFDGNMATYAWTDVGAVGNNDNNIGARPVGKTHLYIRTWFRATNDDNTYDVQKIHIRVADLGTGASGPVHVGEWSDYVDDSGWVLYETMADISQYTGPDVRIVLKRESLGSGGSWGGVDYERLEAKYF